MEIDEHYWSINNSHGLSFNELLKLRDYASAVFGSQEDDEKIKQDVEKIKKVITKDKA